MLAFVKRVGGDVCQFVKSHLLSRLRAVCPFVKPIIASEPNDEEEDADEGDAPPEPCELPPGFAFAALPPTEAALC